MTKLSDLPAAGAINGTERGIVNQGAGDGTTSLLSAAQTLVNRGTGAYSFATGYSAAATAESSIGIGTYANATGQAGIAIGSSATATQSEASSLGFSADATAGKATAIGSRSSASAESATAIGSFCAATAAYSTAIGFAVTNALSNSVSIGPAGLVIAESSGLGNPPANAGMLFVEDNGSGKSRLVVKWPDGTTEVLATQA